MLCQSCKKENASVKCIQVINEKKTEWILCTKCAEQQGLTNPLAGLPEFFGKILANLIGEELPGIHSDDSDKTDESSPKCPSCKISFSEFEKKGIMGCPQCYDTFEAELKILLRRIHGSNHHIGSRPRQYQAAFSGEKIAILRQNLNSAVKQERYEDAAELRNRITDLENNNSAASNADQNS